jgi:hypothetical protein
MSASNRAAAITKLHNALKKHYAVEPVQPTRPLMEHILYASLLEDCPTDLADEGLAKCEQEFFDWNEVRVTTVTELSQVLSGLPDPAKAAMRLKSNLQSVFEEFYSFDLEHLKKENLGKAVAKFEKMPGMSPFVLNYTIQHGLGGHAIPVDYSAMSVMLVTGIASQAEAISGRVPGLERAVPKNKAIEFSSLLHQAAVTLNKNSKDKLARGVLDSVVKGASQRLDEWLSHKVEAKKQRAARREADRIAEESKTDEEEVLEELRPTKKKGKKEVELEAPKEVSKKGSPTPTSAKKTDAKVTSPSKTKSNKSTESEAVGKPDPKAASTKKSAPTPTKETKTDSKATPPKKAVTESKKAPEKKGAPEKKVTSEKKTAPEKKVAVEKKGVTEKKSTPLKKDSPDKKGTSVKKSRPEKKPATTKKSEPPKSTKTTTSKSASSASKPKPGASVDSKKSANRKLTKSKPR